MEAITNLDVVQTLSNGAASNTIGLLTIDGACTIDELGKIAEWMVPKMGDLLLDSNARFSVVDLFKHGKFRYLLHLKITKISPS